MGSNHPCHCAFIFRKLKGYRWLLLSLQAVTTRCQSGIFSSSVTAKCKKACLFQLTLTLPAHKTIIISHDSISLHIDSTLLLTDSYTNCVCLHTAVQWLCVPFSVESNNKWIALNTILESLCFSMDDTVIIVLGKLAHTGIIHSQHTDSHKER